MMNGMTNRLAQPVFDSLQELIPVLIEAKRLRTRRARLRRVREIQKEWALGLWDEWVAALDLEIALRKSR